MDQFKFFLERFRKEVIVGVLLIVFVAGGIGIYFFCKKNSSSEMLLSSMENVEEVKLEEENLHEEESKTQKIRIDIKGEVKNPGVYIATEDMRVVDMIEMAGGLTKNADTSVNNLSRKVFDEMVIMIYSKKEVEKFSEVKKKEQDILEKSQTIIEGLINEGALQEEDILNNHPGNLENASEENIEVSKKVSINTATKDELLSLNGIGESKAVAIIAYREEHGRFEKIEDIMNVSGIGESLFAKIKDFITI